MKTLNTIVNTVKETYPSIRPETERFATYVILLASAVVGPNIKRVAKFTGLTRDEVSQRAYFLRSNGIWNGNRVYANWDHPTDGPRELKFDVAAAEGNLRRRPTGRKVIYG